MGEGDRSYRKLEPSADDEGVIPKREREPFFTLERIGFFSVVLFFIIGGAILYVVFWPVPPTGRLVIINAKIWTGDPENPIAQAMSIGEERIIDVGYNWQIKPHHKEGISRLIDGGGTLFVMPGLSDSHIHMGSGHGMAAVQLRNASTPHEFIDRISQFAIQQGSDGRWIRDGIWDHELWGGELPSRQWVDPATQPNNNPLWLCRYDGHMCLANTLALTLANVTRYTPDVPGGEIVRDLQGDPTGILKDNAMLLVTRVLPPYTEHEDDVALNASLSYLASVGVTSVHHMGSWDDLNVFERADARNHLTARIYAAVPLNTYENLREVLAERGRNHISPYLKIGNLKGFVDGSLGSHTAYMWDPYVDTNNTDYGLLITPVDDLYNWILNADFLGLQVSLHAIGDRANSIILDIFENVTRTNEHRDRRFRVEHAQHLQASDIDRYARMGVVASVQPYHIIEDGVWAEKLLGPQRIHHSYPFRSLIDQQVSVAFGSDWDVAPANPAQGIYAAVSRATLDNKNPDGWIPEQKISVEECLKAYTQGAAYAEFEENSKGVLKAGYLADFVVFDRDLTAEDDSTFQFLWDAKVKMTVVGGRIVYEE